MAYCTKCNGTGIHLGGTCPDCHDGKVPDVPIPLWFYVILAMLFLYLISHLYMFLTYQN